MRRAINEPIKQQLMKAAACNKTATLTTLLTLHIKPTKLLYSWMEFTVKQHTFLKFDESQTTSDFQQKTLNSRWNRKTPDLVKIPSSGNTDCDCLCPKKTCVSVTLCVFAQGLSLAKCTNIRCIGVDWLVHTTLGSNYMISQFDVTMLRRVAEL